MTRKSKLVAFFLSVLPGLPQLYLGHTGLGLALLLPSLFFYVAGLVAAFGAFGAHAPEIALVFLLLLIVCWLISVIHALTFSSGGVPLAVATPQGTPGEPYQHPRGLNKQTFTMTALIPGGGQMYLGEMNRGLPLLIAFFGWLTFSAYLAINLAGGFIVLWGLLPVIWAYSLFDALQGWRQATLDATQARPALLDDMENGLVHRQPQRGLAIALSAIPGLGHLYLGQMNMGLAMLAGFLLLLSLNNYGFLNLAFVIVPLLWFYSVFDVLAQLPTVHSQEITPPNWSKDQRVGQRWLGTIALAAGVLILTERLVIPYIDPRLMHLIQPLIVSLVLIVVGVRLLLGVRAPAPSAASRPDRGEQS